jgi:tripartite ATP-independent transporter DctM subunit
VLGWCPGGTAIVTVVVCAFFTTFTGGSGVTILALGGLLLPALLKDGYPEGFSLGMLTAAGSLGLLFPPALPLILYGVVAEVPIEDLFIGGIVPGFVLVALMAAWGIHRGLVSGAVRTVFHWRRALHSLWTGKYELAIPVIALGTMFSGWATLVEASAVTALYALIVQVFVHRDLTIRGDLLRVMRNCTVLLGGVLIILGVAKGLTNYLVDAMIPAQLLTWVEAHVESRLVFLLALNLFLLLVGCLMDIFSAIVVVVPLIEPIGESFGIHPVHLGIIFIANLELGYLTPPVGLNLFLASYRFEKPLLVIYRATVPALLILGAGVLMITYVEGFTLGLLRLLGRA